MYRRPGPAIELLVVHPGGPFWATKDEGVWTIPKGEIDEGEEPLAAAMREFREETGLAPCGPFLPLTAVKQKGGKTIAAWAFEGDCNPLALRSNTFELEWPPRSGRVRTYPEVDRATFAAPAEARRLLNVAQAAFVDELLGLLVR